MKFTKQQCELIAYAVALLEGDITNKEVLTDAHNVLGGLQAEGIWGTVEIDN